jgi:hypothetical protein
MRRHAGDDSGAALADEYVVPFIGRDLATAVWTSLAHVLDDELHYPTLLPGASRHRQQPLEQVKAQGILSRLPGAATLAGKPLSKTTQGHKPLLQVAITVEEAQPKTMWKQ